MLRDLSRFQKLWVQQVVGNADGSKTHPEVLCTGKLPFVQPAAGLSRLPEPGFGSQGCVAARQHRLSKVPEFEARRTFSRIGAFLFVVYHRVLPCYEE